MIPWKSSPVSLLFIALVIPRAVSAEQMTGPALPAGKNLTVVERSDLRRYEDGKFVGLESREVRGILDHTESPQGDTIEGTFYVIGELIHGGTSVSQKVDTTFPAAWTVAADGFPDVGADQPYPIMRGFPVLPAREMAVGDSWKAPGARMVEPLRDGKFTRVKFMCEYRYVGDKTIDGRTVRMITAKYALRYRKTGDASSDERLESVSGTHTVSISLSADAGDLSFMNDVVEETYKLADSKTVTYKGFILTWFNTSAPLDKATTVEKIAEDLAGTGTTGIGVEQKKEGVSVTLNDIHFVAEEAAVLPDERPRLQAVAEALKRIPGRSFLVIGHTADVGTPESQQNLSVRRAKAIVDFLVSQGIASGRFLYEGRGGTQPVAPNDTEENKARNRRVEIVILED